MISFDELHEQQQRLLYFIWQFGQEQGYAPTYGEMGDALGLSSKSHVDYHLQELETLGCISRKPHKSRSVSLTNLGRRLLDVEAPTPRSNHVVLPMLGYIVAGEPVMTDQAMETVELTRDIVPDAKDLYGLRVRGDSMEGAHIRHGDIVVMRPQAQTPHNGDIVAVRLRSKDEVTLKHFHHDGAMVRLVPANPDYKDIVVPADDVEVQGKVVAVIRQY